AGLGSQLCEEVVLLQAPTNRDSRTLTRNQMQQWLEARWQPGLTIVEVVPLTHYGAINLRSGPWRPQSPSGAFVTFTAHQLDRTCRPSSSGQWMIDVISYEA